MLVDKTVRCSIDGLNQKFRVSKDENERLIVTNPEDFTGADLDTPILRKINVEPECQTILEGTEEVGGRIMDLPNEFIFLRPTMLKMRRSNPHFQLSARDEFKTTKRINKAI